MRKLTLLLLFCGGFLTVKSESLRGYVITLDGKYISGTIEQVNSSEFNVAVAFINDFGTIYHYNPALIKGFVYLKGNDQFVFESLYHQGRWIFLQLLYQGEEISLFKYPEIQVNWVIRGQQVNSYSANQRTFWIKHDKKSLFVLKRKHFKNKFSRLIEEKAPELAQKIGKRGYRYYNIERILAEYDEIITSKIKKI